MTERNYLDVEDLDVYQKLCRLHIEVSALTQQWPAEEKYELGSQVRRSSNSSPAQLAERNDDRHVKNKIEGVNRSRGEAGETVHHLFIALLKQYITRATYNSFRARYRECIRMLNGLERTLERKLPAADRRWEIAESTGEYGAAEEPYPRGWPSPLTPDTTLSPHP